MVLIDQRCLNGCSIHSEAAVGSPPPIDFVGYRDHLRGLAHATQVQTGTGARNKDAGSFSRTGVIRSGERKGLRRVRGASRGQCCFLVSLERLRSLNRVSVFLVGSERFISLTRNEGTGEKEGTGAANVAPPGLQRDDLGV